MGKRKRSRGARAPADKAAGDDSAAGKPPAPAGKPATTGETAAAGRPATSAPATEAAAPPPTTRRWPWAELAVAAAAVVASAPIWLPRYLATMDGPQHVLAAHMAIHFDDEAFGFARYFTVNPTHISPILGDRILRGLMVIGLSPPLALKVFLSLWVAGTAAAAAYAASWRRRDGAALGLVALLTVPGVALGMGFFEYLLSLPLALAALGVLLRGPALGGRRLLALGALALASVLAHPFTLVALLPALAAAAWATRAPPARVIAGLLPAVAVGGYAFLSHVGASARVTQPTVWAPLGDSLRTLGLDGFGGLAPTGLIGLAGAAAVLVPAAATAWRDGGRASRLLLGAAALYAILTITTPSSTFNWALFHHRFVPLVWLMALAACGAGDVRSRFTRLGLVVAGLALATQTVVAARVNLRLDAGLREYAAAAAAVPRASRILPLNFDPRGASDHRLIRPFLHAWAYIVMERGGMTPYVFATLPSHAFHFRDRPKAPSEFLDQSYSCRRAGMLDGTPACDAFHRRRLESYAERARAFDAVVAWQPPPALRPVLEGAGFVLRSQTARSAVYERTATTTDR